MYGNAACNWNELPVADFEGFSFFFFFVNNNIIKSHRGQKTKKKEKEKERMVALVTHNNKQPQIRGVGYQWET